MLTAVVAFFMLASPESEIRAVFDMQVAAWNRGDLAAYMEGYENSAATTFVTPVAVRRGFQTIFDRYKITYPDKAKMGQLSFTEVEVRLLTADTALAMGKYQVRRSAADGGELNGRFSIIFKKGEKGWRIIHDHSS